jgi:hypothetical protein
MTLWRCLWLVAIVTCNAPTAAADLFPFRLPWDDASVNLTNLSAWNAKPAGKSGFVRAENGHLYAGAKRIRFLGVNIVSSGAAPSRDEAERIAARLARFGVNAVRFHHLDTSTAPNGLLQKDRVTFDPEALERFDYFFAALKKEGIYADLNLHVGRRYPGFADWGEETPRYWKGVDNFHPPMIALQRDYALGLLTHVNPYTGLRYVDDPAVAFIEINNENGLIREWRTGGLNGMTEPYRDELARQWQAWLKARYRDTAALSAAWGVREEPLGAEMLTAKLGVRSGEPGWNLQVIGDGRATLATGEDGAAVLAMTQAGKERWHIQMHQNGLALAAEQPYTLSLALRADKPTKVILQAMQAHAPWQTLWRDEVTVGPQWQVVKRTFAPVAGDGKARLTLGGLGRTIGTLRLKDASLRPGGVLGLLPGENLGDGAVAVFDAAGFMGRTPPAQRDWIGFLWDTETAYWTGLARFLKDDLGARPLIIGTQTTYSPAPIQAALDVVDSHGYWQHPVFPGRRWDPDDWTIANSPMAGVANGGTLPDLALRRVPGKPFVVTEYNHSAPSHFQGEALPLLAAYGALQDWDGIFLYSFGLHGKTWDPGFINNYFDSFANPVKMAGLIPAAALFRRGDVASAGVAEPGAADVAAWIEALRANYRIPGAESFGADRATAFMRAVGIATPPSQPASLPYASLTGELAWGVNGGRTVTFDTPHSKGLIGARMDQPFEAGGVALQVTEARNDWGVLLLTRIDAGGFAAPGRALLTALGQVENTGQMWQDAGKTTLGRNWGGAPTVIEGIAGRVTLPVAAGWVRAWALDEHGNRRDEIKVTGGPRATLDIGESHRTLWYEIEIGP